MEYINKYKISSTIKRILSFVSFSALFILLIFMAGFLIKIVFGAVVIGAGIWGIRKLYKYAKSKIVTLKDYSGAKIRSKAGVNTFNNKDIEEAYIDNSQIGEIIDVEYKAHSKNK